MQNDVQTDLNTNQNKQYKSKLVDFEWKTNNNIMNVSKCCILFIYTKISLLKWAIQEKLIFLGILTLSK